MNERIRELAIQSGLPTALDYHQKRYEKFAELIVRECAYVSEGYFGFKDNTPGTAIAKEIKQHFGVEE